MRPNLLDIERKQQFPDPKTQTQRKYNRMLEDLYDTYEEILENKDDLSFTRDELEGAGSDIMACAQGYDADDIRRACDRVQELLYDFESQIADVDDNERFIDRTVKEMMKIEKRMKFKPTLRNEIVSAAESLIED